MAFRTLILMVILTALLVWIAKLLGWGTTGMVVMLVIGVGFQLLNFWFSSTIVLKAYGARILEEGEIAWLQNGIREMTERAGMPMPKVAIIEKSAPNAFATGRSPKNAVVAITRGALDVLDKRQALAVMGHELAHVKHRDMLTMTLVAGIVSVIGILAFIARFGAMFGGGGNDDDGGAGFLALIAVAILAPIMAMIVQFAISRSREYAADKGGAALSNDPAALADALEALHRSIPGRKPLTETGTTAHMMIASPFFGMKVGALFSTHPDPIERIRRLREMAAGR